MLSVELSGEKVETTLGQVARLLGSSSPIVVRFALRAIDRIHTGTLSPSAAAAAVYRAPAEQLKGKLRKFWNGGVSSIGVTEAEAGALVKLLAASADPEKVHVSVTRRAIATMSKLHKAFLAVRPSSVWSAYVEMLTLVREQSLVSTDIGVRLQAVKFLHVVTESYASSGDMTLEQDALELARLLLSRLNLEATSTATAIMGALTSLAGKFPPIARIAVGGFVDLASRRPDHLIASQYTSLQHVLMCHLMCLDKEQALEPSLAADVFNCLTNDLNVRADLIQRKRVRPEGAATMPDAKRVKYDVDHILAQLPPPEAMNPEVLVDLVLEFMGNMPAVAPQTFAQPMPSAVEAPSTETKAVAPLPKTLLTLPLESSVAESLVETAFRRIINGTGHGRIRTMRSKLLVRLAKNRPLDHGVTTCLLDHCAASLATEREVALLWLTQEATSFESAVLGRYEAVLNGIVSRAIDHLQDRDRSLASLLVDVPELPESTVALIVELARDPARATIGLAALRDVILKRPRDADSLLKHLLSLTSEVNTRVRTPAVSLVANKFLAGDRFGPATKEAAHALVRSALEANEEATTLSVDAEAAAAVLAKAREASVAAEAALAEAETGIQAALTKVRTEERSMESIEAAEAAQQLAATRREEAVAHRAKLAEAQEAFAAADAAANTWVECRINLYLALCTKEPETLLPALGGYYGDAGERVRALLRTMVSNLTETLGPDCEPLHEFVEKVSGASIPLGLQVLTTWTESKDRTPARVVRTARAAADALDDVRFLIPVLASLPRAQVLAALPKVLVLADAEIAGAIERLCSSDAALSPKELFIELHLLPGAADASDQAIFRGAMIATQLCLTSLKSSFTQDVVASALQQLVDRSPTPHLYMRNVIVSVGQFPRLKKLVVGPILRTLAGRAVWRDHDNVWKGFVRAARMLLPDSCPALSLVPADTLDTLLAEEPGFIRYLAVYAEQRLSGLSEDRRKVIARHAEALAAATAE